LARPDSTRGGNFAHELTGHHISHCEIQKEFSRIDRARQATQDYQHHHKGGSTAAGTSVLQAAALPNCWLARASIYSARGQQFYPFYIASDLNVVLNDIEVAALTHQPGVPVCIANRSEQHRPLACMTIGNCEEKKAMN
jgi:hypothetical protein